MSSRIERFQFGIVTGAFMLGAVIMFSMLVDNESFWIHDLYQGSSLYFYIIAMAVGLILSQIYIWYYNKGLRRHTSIGK